jgi:hypothetical protein
MDKLNKPIEGIITPEGKIDAELAKLEANKIIEEINNSPQETIKTLKEA